MQIYSLDGQFVICNFVSRAYVAADGTISSSSSTRVVSRAVRDNRRECANVSARSGEFRRFGDRFSRRGRVRERGRDLERARDRERERERERQTERDR